MSSKYNSKNDIIFTGIFGAITFVVIMYAIADRGMIDQMLKVARWDIFGLAALAVLVAYSAMSFSLIYANKLFKIEVPRYYQFMVHFVTLAIGNLMDFGGAIGYSLRAGLLSRHKATFLEAMGASIYHSYFMFLILLISLPIGIIGLLDMHMINSENQKVFILAIIVSVAGTVLAACFMFIKRVRLKVLHGAAKLIKRVLKKDSLDTLEKFSENIDAGIANTKAHPLDMLRVLFFLVLYWGFSMLVLWLCFYSLGVQLNAFVLMTGFSVGIMVTTFSFIPGGIGIQEASTAGVISLLGVDFHLCVLVTFVFRVIYYLFTTFISLIVYWGVLRRELVVHDYEYSFEELEAAK